MHAPDEQQRGRNGRRLQRTLVVLVILVALAAAALEFVARKVKVEFSETGTSVIQPRGFLSRANIVGFLRVAYTQWVDADDRKECFSVGEGCFLTANDTDRDGHIDEIYITLKDEAIVPYLSGHDKQVGGLRLFAHVDHDGVFRMTDESLAELSSVLQQLFDHGMHRFAVQLSRDR